jgi:PAS domain S-box-containing protein
MPVDVLRPPTLGNDAAPVAFRPDLILAATNVGIVFTNTSGRVEYANDAACQKLGVDKASLFGRFIDEVSQGAWADFKEILRTEQPQAGVKIQTSGGVVIADRNPVFDGRKVVGVVSIFKEISQYEETAKQLNTYRNMANQLDAVIRSSYDGLYITNGNADTLLYNKAYLRIAGLKAEDFEGKNIRELIRQGTIKQSPTLEVLQKRKHVTTMQEFSNGRTAIITSNPVFDESGKIVLVVTNARDITELNELREQLEGTRTLAARYRDELTKLSLGKVDGGPVVFRSAAMEHCVHLALRVADVSSPVLLTGQSGVGKGMLAKLVHGHGHLKDGPFIHVNCGAIPASLMESELFGYEKGAFTNASAEGKPGLFEIADGGTIFLDEIGEVSLDLQVKLLKVLEDSEIRRVGGTRSRKIAVRIIAATNRNLREMVLKDHLFREDLYFRLNVFPIHVPPLCERPEDILPLVEHVLAALNAKYKAAKHLRPEALEMLHRYSFPGNIRELQNVVERAFILADGNWLEASHLPPELQASAPRSPKHVVNSLPAAGLDEMLATVERGILEDCMRRHKTTHEVARVLKVNQSTVVRKMKKLRISIDKDT